MRNKSYFKERKKTRKPITKAFLFIIILIIILVPILLAVAGYFIKSNNIVGANSLKVSLYYDNLLIGEQSDDPQNQSADELVLIFDEMVNKMKKTDTLPSDLNSREVFSVNLSTRTDSYNYECYFSFNKELESYCLDNSGVAYIIPKETTMAFLSSSYAEVLYENSVSPKMYSSSDEEICPSSHDWSYKNISGEFRQASPLPKLESSLEYNMSGSLGLSFDTAPDECNVKIYKSGIKIYDDTLEGLSSFLVETGTSLKFDVVAKWDQNETNDFYGEVSYKFDAIVRDRAKFSLSKPSATLGDLVVVSALNVLDSTKVEFSCEPSLKYDPIFVSDNGVVRTLLPIANDLETGEYKLHFSYGATTETLSLIINTAEKSKDYTLKAENAALVANLSNKKNIDEVSNILKSLSTSNKIFTRNEFIDYKANGAEAIAKYGSLVTTNNGNVAHSILGTQYVWKDVNNETVVALNSGVVAKIGNCTYLGDYVIVDHGIGIKTVYSHLDKIFVKEGDVLLRSEIIGLCGSLDIVSPSGVFVMCFVYDVAIDYDNIAGKSLPFYYPELKEEE